MITTPAIYAQDESLIAQSLLPPQKRLTNWIAWLTVQLTSNQWLRDLIFKDYYGGSISPLWATGNPYNYGDRARYTDNSIYEVININGLAPFSGDPPLNPSDWIKVLDTWIGVAERVRYTGQLIVLEYLLNKYFNVGAPGLPFTGASHVNQIYISKNYVNSTDFWMPLDSVNAISFMPLASKFATSFMPLTTSTLNANAFTIYVPNASIAGINAMIPASSADTYKTLITNIVNNYVRAGRTFSITNY